jgi:hypothetical protein
MTQVYVLFVVQDQRRVLPGLRSSDPRQEFEIPSLTWRLSVRDGLSMVISAFRLLQVWKLPGKVKTHEIGMLRNNKISHTELGASIAVDRSLVRQHYTVFCIVFRFNSDICGRERAGRRRTRSAEFGKIGHAYVHFPKLKV